MLEAVHLARKGKGRTAPNPCVGALLVDGRGCVVAQGFHTACGKPHAEVEAIADARSKTIDPAQCALFVTLEPCNHQGRTPACTGAILDAGIKTVVVGTADPNDRVEGGGIQHLRSRGVEVQVGVAEQACRDLIADFITWNTTDRPYVYLKLASTLDGKIASRTGHSCWVTGPRSREEVHRLRGRVQAVMVGGQTFRKDDPRLTPRLPGQETGCKDPLAVVVTTTLPDAGSPSHLLTHRSAQTLFLTSKSEAQGPGAAELTKRGCRIIGLPEDPSGRLDLGPGLKWLRNEAGCLYVLCEGGGGLASSLAEQGLVDELWLFLAPRVLGDEQGVSLFSGRSVQEMDQCLQWRRIGTEPMGEDLHLTFRPRGR